MSPSGLLRLPSRRRPSMFRPALEGLEGRLVLSQATAMVAPVRVPAQVHALARPAAPALSVPITVTGINVTGLTSAANGTLNLVGTLTGTILGQSFTTPLTGTITPARNARSCPVLNLNLQPIHLSLLGLNVNTSALCLNINARRNGGLLGNLLCGGLNDVLGSAAGSSTAQATTQLNGLLGNTQLLNALDQSLARARPRLTSFTPAQGTSCPVLNLALGPVNLNVLGLRVRLDNCARGPVTVNVSATQGGGLLGNLLCGLTGNPRGRALTNAVAGVLNQITNTPVPSVAQLAALTSPPAPGGATPSGSGSSSAASLADPQLLQIDLKPIDVNLLGLEVKTSEIIVTVSAQPGSGKLLGNLLTTVANLVNLQGVNSALNNVLGNVVNLANSATLSVSGVLPGGALNTTTTTAAVPVLTAHVAPVHLDLLGAVVDTSPIDVSIIAHPGTGNVLGNVIVDVANLLNTLPKHGKIDIPFLTRQLQTLNTQLAAITPSITPPPSPSHTPPPGATNVLSLVVAPINLNLLGLVLHTDQIQVNADAQTGSGDLLGNLLSGLLNELNGTPANMSALNDQINTLLARVIGTLNATTLSLPAGILGTLSQTLQTLALPNLVNTSGTSDSVPVLNLDIASASGTTAPPIDVDLLGLIVTTSDVHAQLTAQTGDGQILGNLVYNVSHLLDPGGALGLLTILQALAL